MVFDKLFKFFIVNCGEIVFCIIWFVKVFFILIVFIYIFVDVFFLYVFEVEEFYVIGDGSDFRGYLNIDGIVKII